jgi:hypothetical protein
MRDTGSCDTGKKGSALLIGFVLLAIIQAELCVPAMAIAAWRLKKSPPKRAFCTLPNFNSGPA